MKKLHQGLPIQISYDAMGADKGDVVIGLKDGNAKKLMSAFKRGKGLRMSMDDEELDYTMKSGSGLIDDIKKVGRKVERGVVRGANKVAKPVKKVISKIPEEQRKQMKSMAMNVIKTSAGTFADMLAEATGEDELAEDLEEAIIDIAEEMLSGERIVVGSKVLPLAKRAVNKAVDMIDDPKMKATAKAILKKAGMGLYGKAGMGLSGGGMCGCGLSGCGMCGSGLSGRGLSGGAMKTADMPRKGSQEMRDKMAMVRAGKKGSGNSDDKSGEGFGKFIRKVGRKAKKVGRKAKKATFGKRIGDEMNVILPIAGGVAGGVAGSMLGPKGAMVGSALGTKLGKRGASEVNKKGLGLRGNGLRGRGMIKPANDVMTLSPYTSINAPAFNPFYPKNSYQNGGSGENQGY